jgi:hypothetical protein
MAGWGYIYDCLLVLEEGFSAYPKDAKIDANGDKVGT